MMFYGSGMECKSMTSNVELYECLSFNPFQLILVDGLGLSLRNLSARIWDLQKC